MNERKDRSAFWIALAYAVFGGLYIVLSDRIILLVFGPDLGEGELFRIQTVKGLIFIVVTAVLLFLLVRRNVARINKYHADLKLNEKKNQHLLRKINVDATLAEEEQRKKIASNIHDHLGQLLVISKMKIIGLQDVSSSNQVRNELGIIASYLSKAIENSKNIVYDLSPPILYELGLVDTLRWLAEKVEEEHHLDVEFSCDSEEIRVSQERSILIFRVVQELCNNVIKHAKATRMVLQIRHHPKMATIAVKDNGVGFDTSTLKDSRSVTDGFGIFSVRERIRNLDGYLEINSVRGKGTTATITVPVDERDGS